MRLWLFFLMASTMPLGAVPAKAAASCNPVPGAREIIAGTAKIRFLIIGEIHGTNETPALVADLACEIGRGRPVTVALEFPLTSATALNRYLASDGATLFRRQLLRSPIWARSMADGRSSKAMFELIERLRQLRASGAWIRLVAFQPSEMSNLDQHYYDLAMAANWARIADETPDNLNLILVGQVHAGKRAVRQYPFAPAASHLPSADVLSFRGEAIEGAAWNCQEDGCGAHTLAGAPGKERSIARFASETDGFDGAYSIGPRYSASEPVLAK